MTETVTPSRCRNCKRRVIVVCGEAYDAEPSKVLTPNADGLWGFVEGYLEHRCEEKER